MLTSHTRLILLTGISLAVASLSGAFVGILIYGTLLLDDEAIPLQWLVMTPLMILVRSSCQQLSLPRVGRVTSGAATRLRCPT
jgi:hypothetical protein